MLQKILLILSNLSCWVLLHAQPNTPLALQQQLFCNADIVWAGTLDLDILPDVNTKPDWDNFHESGLSNHNFTQSDTTLVVGDTTLAAYIWQALLQNGMPLYAVDSLQDPIPKNQLNVLDWYQEDDPDGNFPVLDAHHLEILRLRCYVYYNQRLACFQLVPFAVGLITTEYDGSGSRAFYSFTGWMPVATSGTSSLDWEKLIHRDIDLRQTFVFKQAWTLEQCMEQLIDLAFEQPSIQQKYASDQLNHPTLLSADTLRKLVSYLGEEEDPETYEILKVIKKIDASRLIGSTFSIQLGWNNAQQRLHAQPIGYAPIQSNMDSLCEGEACLKERMYLKRMFYARMSRE